MRERDYLKCMRLLVMHMKPFMSVVPADHVHACGCARCMLRVMTLNFLDL
jgi:hypothetical protein